MNRLLPLLILGYLLSAVPLQAQEGMQEKIRLLEQQIQELKTLRAQQAVGKQKAEQCLKAVGRDNFCTCIGENLPAAVSFEQYIHTTITSKEEIGYNTMLPEQQKIVDHILETREKCIEKGFF
ncbi:MAG: hypothetical protein PHP95_16500 [Desulfuromonadaceae bacterium]|nr:hypothetical protein [Desulfuromonadaceae bacterium]MDD2850051.1 hypothetical protein [Desulfuromonadaceae bacterium]MDD4129455.1 hypothetical protein [Desulfuromonadaceae bacterium]